MVVSDVSYLMSYIQQIVVQTLVLTTTTLCVDSVVSSIFFMDHRVLVVFRLRLILGLSVVAYL